MCTYKYLSPEKSVNPALTTTGELCPPAKYGQVCLSAFEICIFTQHKGNHENVSTWEMRIADISWSPVTSISLRIVNNYS